MSKYRVSLVLFELYNLALGILVVVFWTYYLISFFSYRKEATDSTPFANFLRVLPGNISLFSPEYDVNVIFVSIGSVFVFFISTFLHLVNMWYDNVKLWEYDSITTNIYLPETIINGLSAIESTNGGGTNLLLTIFLSGGIIYEFIADITRSIHSLFPRHLTGFKIRQTNGEPLSASLRDKTREECRDGNCAGEPRTEDYYVKIGLQRICMKDRRHGGVRDKESARVILRLIDDFEKQEKLLYALVNAGITQAGLGMSIKEYSDISGADIYTRFAVLLAVFTISFNAGPLLKSRTFERLKKDMNEFILEAEKREPRDVLQEDFVWIV